MSHCSSSAHDGAQFEFNRNLEEQGILEPLRNSNGQGMQEEQKRLKRQA